MDPELEKISETIRDEFDGEQKWACMLCKQMGKSVVESFTQCSVGLTTNGSKHLRTTDHKEMIKNIKNEKEQLERVRIFRGCA